MNLIYFYRVANRLYKLKVPIFPFLIQMIYRHMYGCHVSYKTTIGKGSTFAYGGIGVVIHERAVIGENCIIGQGITIGGRSKAYDVPIIGNNVYLGAGCRILGPILVGDNVIVGPNSVVLSSLGANSIFAGIPARYIKKCKDIRDFV